MRLCFVLVSLCLALSLCATAQPPTLNTRSSKTSNFSLADAQQRIVSLAGMWRFQPGDDLAWARPEFDDSQWVLIPGDRPWPRNGPYRKLSGFAWYRFQVDVPPNAGTLSIELPPVETSYELFADGVRIGSLSSLPLDQQRFRTTTDVFQLPHSGPIAHKVTFALRVWHWPDWASYYAGGPRGTAFFGSSALIERDAQRGVRQHAWGLVDLILLVCLETIAGLTALGLFVFQATRKEYLFFALLLLFSAAGRCAKVWVYNHTFWIIAGDSISNVLFAVSGICAACFYLHLLKGSRNVFFWSVILTTALAPAADLPVLSRVSVALIGVLETLLTLPFFVWVTASLLVAARKGGADARLLLFPVLLQQLVAIGLSLLWIAFTAGWQNWFTSQDLLLSQWPLRYTLSDLTSLFYLIGVLAILVYRSARAAREQDRMQADLAAARTLQQVLIPAQLPATPGFNIETAYRPALEVGGDFFQIISLRHGTTLAILGDVAGKGLPAAMTVSLIVGALQSLAETTDSPAAILAGLNRRLLRQGTVFATAILLRLHPSGEVTLANAGHLAPYWNGTEVATEPALPLGLDASAEPCETTLRLSKGDRLTLMTDGVLEATRKHELFGFEQAERISTQGAQAIADAAVLFGQVDDITVLSLVAAPS